MRRASVTVVQHAVDRVPCICTPDVEVIFQRNDSMGLGSITVDWVNDELYWIERLAGGYRVSRLLLSISLTKLLFVYLHDCTFVH